MMTISFDAQVLERHPSGVKVHLDGSGCSACGRHCSSRQELMIPGKFAEGRIKISLSSGVLGKLLVNSLYLPLAMFVIFAGLASYVTASEIVQGLAAVAGLALGIIRCRHMTFNDLKIE